LSLDRWQTVKIEDCQIRTCVLWYRTPGMTNVQSFGQVNLKI